MPGRERCALSSPSGTAHRPARTEAIELLGGELRQASGLAPGSLLEELTDGQVVAEDLPPHLLGNVWVHGEAKSVLGHGGSIGTANG